jgi:hypothetical protein
MLRFFPIYRRIVGTAARGAGIRMTELLSLSTKPFSSVTLAFSPSKQAQIRLSEKAPSRAQLRSVALLSAFPMIGFGFMDTLVLIQAGEAIDMSLGVAFGLSTMAAAALGQCVSNVAGLTSGGIVDAAVTRLNILQHGLTPSQLALRVTRMYNAAGSCMGVVLGGLLGMISLLFTDTTRADRAKKEIEIQSVLESIMNEAHTIVGCERATLWLLNEEADELRSYDTIRTNNQARMQRKSGAVATSFE